MKIYCSENILLNIIKLSESNTHLTVEDYEYLNEIFRDDILSYFKDKYPPTLNKEVNKRLRNLV